jgi:hypothetical protein
MARRRAGQAHGTGAGDVRDHAWADAGGDRAVIAGGEDIAEQREILDLAIACSGSGSFSRLKSA